MKNLDTYKSCGGIQVRVRACYANDECCGIANYDLWSSPSEAAFRELPEYELRIDGDPSLSEVNIQWYAQEMNKCD